MRIVDKEFVDEHLALIAVGAAGQRENPPSYSWHVFDWMCWKLRLKYPPREGGGVIGNITT